MQHDFQQYRFARIEGHDITRARLEAQFKDGITDLGNFEKAIEQQLTMETTCTPWRKSEIEQMGCREGMWLATLEYYWAHRHELRTCDSEQSHSPRNSNVR